MKKFRVVFCGTPDFAVPTLDLLFHHPSIEVIKVVSMPDRPAGRGMELKSPEVIEFAKSHKIPYLQTENINKETQLFEQLETIDFIVVLAFAQFLGEKILQWPRFGCFNIHTSLLPKYRGAAPIQYALMNGDKETGVSIQKMVKKMDAGDVALSHKLSISPCETTPQLYTRLKFQAALCMNDFITKLSENSLDFQQQNEDEVSFAPTLNKELGHLKFKEKTKAEIFNLIRALTPWPGTYCFLNNKRLKIFAAKSYHVSISPGDCRNDLGSLIVGCMDGTLRLTQVQLEGKKACSDTELLNGIREDISLS